MWFDATDINGDGVVDSLPAGEQVSTWVDKSGLERNMITNLGGSTTTYPVIKFDGVNQKQVVDFNGKSRMVNSYNLRGADANMWRFDGYSVFGVSRYTGGDNERVISSEGRNWLFGHHGNLIGRYHFDGWVDQGFASDTKFHLFETLHQGRTVNTNPPCTGLD